MAGSVHLLVGDPGNPQGATEVSTDNPMPIMGAGVAIDVMTGAALTILHAHHETHEGIGYKASAVNTSMSITDTLILAFKTPATTPETRMHVTIEFASLLTSTLAVLEGATWTNQTGTKQPIFNRKREASLRSSGVLEDQAQAAFTASDNMILDPAGLAGGLDIDPQKAFAAKNASTGKSRDETEWLLKPATQYAIRLTANENSNAGQILLVWYEHVDKG